ncbi:MAG: hypothetical protein ACRDQA_26655 [Nocardioidaceae bacterium]
MSTQPGFSVHLDGDLVGHVLRDPDGPGWVAIERDHPFPVYAFNEAREASAWLRSRRQERRS